jgi:predicted regulator of Ras-like GTPase activity (Roadblock/LC7/MglB family)
MGTLPQLVEEDVRRLEGSLRELLHNTDASTGLVIDQGGFLIASQGEAQQFDLTTIAALASGAFLANQTIANLVHETRFNSVYQQGENFSMFVLGVDEHCLLVVIFQAAVGIGVVKYYAAATAAQVAQQMQIAHQRAPDASLDLSVVNVANTAEVFRKKT